jgi:hypothetical protein
MQHDSLSEGIWKKSWLQISLVYFSNNSKKILKMQHDILSECIWKKSWLQNSLVCFSNN